MLEKYKKVIIIKNIVYHTFDAYYNEDSEILILGSMPSVKSREANFYYMHPQNRFWMVLEKVFNENIGKDIELKKEFLKKHKIALWDVIYSCEINGSSDASIKNIVVNDIKTLLSKTKIVKIYAAGKKAYELYNKYCLKDTGIEAECLYSSSPANCAISIEKLVENYKVINKEYNK